MPFLLLVVATGAALRLAQLRTRPLSPAGASLSTPGAIVSNGTQPTAAGTPDQALAAGTDVPVVGSPAPDFVLEDIQGRKVRLQDLQGKPVLINFWATWCPPCREEMPHIEEFHRKYGDRVTVLGVDVGESPQKVKDFLGREKYSWRFALDESGEVMQKYLVFAIPTSFFLDKDGVIRAKFIGPMQPAHLRDFARQAGAEL
ncbi:MAG: TlpA family protein disulfide reductase [Limnochordaceae bacterium]|nr:TlpA family protein disulfide reductase [Limnochordaceae bacterium]